MITADLWRGGKLKTGLKCLHNFNVQWETTLFKSGVAKDVLHLVEELHRLMAKYKATDQIGTKSTTTEARKRKGHRKKRGKEEARNLWKLKRKRMPYFSFPGRSRPCWGLWAGHIWYSPTGKQLIVKPYICLPQRQTGHAYATFAGQTGLGFYTWGWMKLSYKDSNSVQMVCLGRSCFTMHVELLVQFNAKEHDVKWKLGPSCNTSNFNLITPLSWHYSYLLFGAKSQTSLPSKRLWWRAARVVNPTLFFLFRPHKAQKRNLTKFAIALWCCCKKRERNKIQFLQ